MCIKKDILATLAYFDLFDYPLKKREIFVFLPNPDEIYAFDQSLNSLLKESVVYRIGEFYSLQDNYALAERRRWGNDKAVGMLKKAERSARMISAFPFVKGVAVSGSLSKKFADEHADIDFFIITAANRLWISRTLLHAFKKLTYLVNRQHEYCMNYFVDEAEPRIREENIYTATEVATILPVYGIEVFAEFYKINNWTKEFLPNNYLHVSSAKEIKTTWTRNLLERFFDNAVGNYIDTLLMKATTRTWRRKTHRNVRNIKGLPMALHTGKHFAKPDPSNFQRKLLCRYEAKVNEVYGTHDRAVALTNKTM